jgi:hypothetical protein
LTVRGRIRRLSRSAASAVRLDATLAVAPVERAAWATKAIERALSPGDVADAAENHETPGEVRTAVIVPYLGRLPALDRCVPESVVIGVVDQPVPAEHEQADQ